MTSAYSKEEQIKGLLSGRATEMAAKVNGVKKTGSAKFYIANFDGVFDVTFNDILSYVHQHGFPVYEWVIFEKPPTNKSVGLTDLYVYEEAGQWNMQEWDERGYPGPLNIFPNKASVNEALLKRILYSSGAKISGYEP